MSITIRPTTSPNLAGMAVAAHRDGRTVVAVDAHLSKRAQLAAILDVITDDEYLELRAAYSLSRPSVWHAA